MEFHKMKWNRYFLSDVLKKIFSTKEIRKSVMLVKVTVFISNFTNKPVV